jgi:GNAT superfamily N-acetyltransferase
MVERITVSRPTNSVYRSESDPAKLLGQLARIRSLADSNKESLGFLPEAAYREAIEKRRLIAMCTSNDGESEVVGFILFGGVFPNARIQQVAVAERHQRTGVASALINLVVSQLEMRGYLSITAAIASDLTAAQAFYERNGFIARLWRPGGQARNRTIVVRARDLATESLLSIFGQSNAHSQNVIDLGLKRRGASRAPLYAIDLNVMFDVVKAKSRPRSSLAESLIGAAFRHQIRLAVAPEFVVELDRTSRDEDADPILRLARQLPRLPEADRTETSRLTALIHNIVFAAPSDGSTPQALSDCRHLAQSALARASGYITSDGKILAARDRLLEEIGIDVASLDEFAALLTSETFQTNSQLLIGTDCVIKSAPADAIRAYLESHRVESALLVEFAPVNANDSQWRGRVVSEAGEIVAAAAFLAPASVDAPARVLVHVRSDHVWCETFADQLIYSQCEEACRSGPIDGASCSSLAGIFTGATRRYLDQGSARTASYR